MKNEDSYEILDRTYKPDKYEYDLEDFLDFEKEKTKASLSGD